MTSVLVLIDHSADAVKRSGFELLAAASRIGTPIAVWVGGGTPPVAELSRHGAQRVLRLDLGTTPPQLTTPVAAAIEQVCQGEQIDLVLLSSTLANKELAAALAVRTGAGVVVDASAVSRTGEDIVTEQVVFSAAWRVTTRIPGPLAVVALKAGSYEPVAGDEPEAPVQTLQLDVSAAAHGVELVNRTEKPTSDRPDLSEAAIVVVGGRGMDGDFSPLEDLADVLGAAIGATRVATDEGWIDHSAQIGQTGVSISPKVYISAGVSGAVHHTAGMRSAERIIAIDTDPDAPIFEIADLGIVGDQAEVLPQATAALRAALEH